MKLIPLTLTLSAVILTSCQNMDNGEAKARHEEMKQLLTSYDSKVTVKQAELEKKVKDQEKTIADLTKLITSTQKELKEWNSSKNKDSIQAALSLKNSPNRDIRRSVMTILGQLPGPASEAGLVEMILNETYSSNISTGISILQNTGSSKIREVCLKILEKGNPTTLQYALKSLENVATEEDVKKVLEISKNLSTSSNDYNVRYAWQHMIKLFIKKGNKDCVPVVLSYIEDSGKDGFSNACWGLIAISKYGNEEHFNKAQKFLRPFITNKNVYMDSDISYYFRENARIEYLPAMEFLIDKARDSYRRYFIDGFINISHPGLAKKLVEEYNTTKDSSTKSNLIKAFQGGYPGTMWFENEKKAQVIPDKELEEMIKKFDK